MIGAVRAMVALVVMTVAGEGLADGDRLPRPESLQPAVDFWKRIYTEVHSDEGLIHDNRALDRVYQRLTLPADLGWRERRDRLSAAKDRLRDALLALARQRGEPRTPLQAGVAKRFPAGAAPSAYREAADRLRFQRGLADRFREGLVRSGRWLPHIRERLARHGVPPELAALPHVESSFRPDAASHAGAVGMWQFTLFTAREYMRVDHVIDSRLDPWTASDAAARLLADNFAELGDWPMAITAYNHGVNGMRRAAREIGEKSIARIIAEYDGPYFGFASRNFYPALLAAAEVDREPARYFGPVEREPVLRTTEVSLPDYTEARALVGASGVDEVTLRRLNPGLLAAVWEGRKYVPQGYRLRLPGDDRAAARAALERLPLTARYTAQRPDRIHRVAAGQTLSGIARRYGLSMDAIARANDLRRRNLLRVGQRLRLPVAGEEPVSLAAQIAAKRGATYTVRPGDTLAAIGRRAGLSVTQLAGVNGIDDPNRIRVGQSLRLISKDELARAVAYSPDEG